MSHPIVEQAFAEFSEVGRVAVVVELKLRLLANKINEIKDYAHAHRIAETEAALLPYLVEHKFISSLEKDHLEISRKIRNKIFHCEFESAVKLIEELRGVELPDGALTGIRLDEAEGTNILEKLFGAVEAMKSGKTAKGLFKVDEATTKEAGIFGWLIEAMVKGVLREGRKIALDSVAVLDRVFDTMAKQDFEKGRSGK